MVWTDRSTLVSALFMGPFYPTRVTKWVSRSISWNPSDPFGDENKRPPDETTPYGVDPLFTPQVGVWTRDRIEWSLDFLAYSRCQFRCPRDLHRIP